MGFDYDNYINLFNDIKNKTEEVADTIEMMITKGFKNSSCSMTPSKNKWFDIDNIYEEDKKYFIDKYSEEVYNEFVSDEYGYYGHIVIEFVYFSPLVDIFYLIECLKQREIECSIGDNIQLYCNLLDENRIQVNENNNNNKGRAFRSKIIKR